MNIPDDFDWEEYFKKLYDEKMKLVEELIEKFGADIFTDETLDAYLSWKGVTIHDGKQNELRGQAAGNP